LIEGIIYKTKMGENPKIIEKISDLKDVDFELA
jgi:hypothetical protein